MYKNAGNKELSDKITLFFPYCDTIMATYN